MNGTINSTYCLYMDSPVYMKNSYRTQNSCTKHQDKGKRFLLGTGRMPHPVGGAMGMTCVIAVKRGYTRFDIILLNIHKTTLRWYCMAVVLRPRLLTFACLARHPANCSTALPKVFSSDLPVCQCTRTYIIWCKT